ASRKLAGEGPEIFETAPRAWLAGDRALTESRSRRRLETPCLTARKSSCYDARPLPTLIYQLIDSRRAMSETPRMTFGIIKPDAVLAGNFGAIIQRITDNGFKIRAMKMLRMSRSVAEGFYAVHRERPFFGELVEFM